MKIQSTIQFTPPSPLQAVVSYQTHPLLNSLAVAHVRLCLAIIAAVFFFLGSACAFIARARFDGRSAP